MANVVVASFVVEITRAAQVRVHRQMLFGRAIQLGFIFIALAISQRGILDRFQH